RLDGDVFRPDNNQSKGTTWLANHGIDPTVFKYQMRMSEDEGSISETFQFDTGDELVQWALPYIVPPEVPDKIAGAVDGVRATLQRKPLLEAEHQFCRDIQERLTFAATQQSQLIYFRDEACRLWDEGLRVVDQMREAASQQRRASEHHATQARDFKAAADEAQHVRNQKQGQRRMAEYLLARL